MGISLVGRVSTILGVFFLISLDMKISTHMYFSFKISIVVSVAGAGGNHGYAICLDIRAAAMVERMEKHYCQVAAATAMTELRVNAEFRRLIFLGWPQFLGPM